MPFIKFDVDKEIARQCAASPEFKRIHEENEEEYKIIGELIRARKQAGLTQEQFAEMIGNKQQTISRIEKHENSPSLKTICNMFNALGYQLQIVKRDIS